MIRFITAVVGRPLHELSTGALPYSTHEPLCSDQCAFWHFLEQYASSLHFWQNDNCTCGSPCALVQSGTLQVLPLNSLNPGSLDFGAPHSCSGPYADGSVTEWCTSNHTCRTESSGSTGAGSGSTCDAISLSITTRFSIVANSVLPICRPVTPTVPCGGAFHILPSGASFYRPISLSSAKPVLMLVLPPALTNISAFGTLTFLHAA